MASAKDIQRRIRSISSTKKITRAMEMVAATKMQRAINAALASRRYANLSWQTVLNLSRALNGNGAAEHSLLASRAEIRTVAVVLVASNRGLCGGFNSAITRAAHEATQRIREQYGADVSFITLGERAKDVTRYYGHHVEASFEKPDIAARVQDVMPAARMVVDGYQAGTYDAVMVAYTDFISASRQQPRVRQLLPVNIALREPEMGAIGEPSESAQIPGVLHEAPEEPAEAPNISAYEFEPNSQAVLEHMVPRLIEVQLYQALLESNASEHSARMQAMHSASDSAQEMVDELTISYNTARQAGITSEILEISAGAEALQEA